MERGAPNAERLSQLRSCPGCGNDMALPTFFIIGTAKAGTTSLHHYLDLHPQIQMSAIKEPNFFAGAENGTPYPGGRVDRLEEYERLFDPSVEVRGEASPSYTNHPRRVGVPERIKALVPHAKLIYLVRDPIARTVSHYQHSVAVGRERRSLEDALSDLSDPLLPWTSTSRYASQLELYLPHFPSSSSWWSIRRSCSPIGEQRYARYSGSCLSMTRLCPRRSTRSCIEAASGGSTLPATSDCSGAW